MKLNLGCWDTKIPDFAGVDLRKFPSVDFVCSIDNLTFAEDESVEEIYASHVLEHFFYTDTLRVLGEWYRVLKHDGILYVAVPDMELICGLIVEIGFGEWTEKVIYGERLYEHSEHRAGFDFTKLSNMLKMVGFNKIEEVKDFPYGIKDASTLRLTINGKKTDRNISLNIIARKP